MLLLRAVLKLFRFHRIFYGLHLVIIQSLLSLAIELPLQAGASTYHSGIDIAAPTGSNLIASFSGEITFLGFQGAGGYTITLKGNEFTASYCHVSPEFKVHVGQKIRKGNVVGQVGPKNVYGVPNNPYKDSNGNPTNGATTGPHLHFTLRRNGDLVNPLEYM